MSTGTAAPRIAGDERGQIDLITPRELGVRRERIAVWRKLQRAEAQHRRRCALVAGAAVGLGRNRVAPAGCRRDRQCGDAQCRREPRLTAGSVPDIGGEAPTAVVEPLDIARLHAVAE
jgi:hypothetical protein